MNLWHFGGGDFNHSHKNEKDYDPPLSLSGIIRFFEQNNDVSMIISENYRNKNGFFSNNYEYWNDLIDIIRGK